MPGDQIKVLLADDHALFRDGLAGLLASYGGIEVLGRAPPTAAKLSPSPARELP